MALSIALHNYTVCSGSNWAPARSQRGVRNWARWPPLPPRYPGWRYFEGVGCHVSPLAIWACDILSGEGGTGQDIQLSPPHFPGLLYSAAASQSITLAFSAGLIGTNRDLAAALSVQGGPGSVETKVYIYIPDSEVFMMAQLLMLDRYMIWVSVKWWYKKVFRVVILAVLYSEVL